MSKYKREFHMEWSSGLIIPNVRASIVGQLPTSKPYVSINPYSSGNPIFIADKDLERFAVNILRALNSKHLNRP